MRDNLVWQCYRNDQTEEQFQLIICAKQKCACCYPVGLQRYVQTTWRWTAMLMLMDYSASVGLSAAGDLRMPFSDTVKYLILGISVTLLLLALSILAWQACRCWTQTRSIYTQEDNVNSDLLYADEKSRTAGDNSGAPNTMVEDISTEVCRLSRCLSQSSIPSGLGIISGSSQAEAHIEEKANVKKVDGSLHCSIYYDQLQSQLVVTVLQVEGLQEEKHILQPFVKLSLLGADSEGMEVDGCSDEADAPVLWTVLQEWRTRIVKGSCNPLFGDQFSYILQDPKQLRHINLRMQVRDFDKFSRHTVLGEVRLHLRQLNISYPLELREQLQIPQKDLVGLMLLSLKFLPTSQRLEVGLLKVRTAFNEIYSDAALYARISVQCNQCKLRYQKSSAVARCPVTVFNEVFMFSLPEFPLQQCKIWISVYETHPTRKSTKHLIGELSLGMEKDSEDEHWTLMMHSVRQPIAKWHDLLI